jgi:hypothetical protein
MYNEPAFELQSNDGMRAAANKASILFWFCRTLNLDQENNLKQNLAEKLMFDIEAEVEEKLVCPRVNTESTTTRFILRSVLHKGSQAVIFCVT